MSHRPALPPGTVLGSGYRLVDLLAEGGFSLVYRAQGPQGTCVVKELFDDERCSRDARRGTLEPLGGQGPLHDRQRQRCREEWDRFRHFKHPHIVEMLDYFEANNTCYLVMPFVEGESLLERVSRQTLSLEEVLTLLGPLSDALDTLHKMRVIHRDVKPDNVWLRASDGKPLLLDTGAARSLEVSRRAGTGLLTMLGAPELRGPMEAGRYGRVGPATDVFALAGVCAFALTGREPPEPSLRDLETPSTGDPLLRWPVPVSEAVAQVIRSGLELKVDRRVQSPGAFYAAMLDAHRRGKASALPRAQGSSWPSQPSVAAMAGRQHPTAAPGAIADLALAAGSNLCAALLIMMLAPDFALLSVSIFVMTQAVAILLCASKRRKSGQPILAIDTVPLFNLIFAFAARP